MRTNLGWAPEIPDHWEVVPLNAIAKMGTGHTPDRSKPEYWEDCTIPWVTTPDVTRRSETLDPLLETEQSISELGVLNSAAVLHPAGTVMLSRTASVGYSLIIGRPMATTQAFVTWASGPRIDSNYLLLVLRAMRPEWERLAYGSTHLTIYMPDLESLRIPLPPIDEQRRIARFLHCQSGKLDDLQSVLDSETRTLKRRAEVLLIEELTSTASGASNESRLKYLFSSVRNGVWGSDPDGGPDDVTCVRVADFDREAYVAGRTASTRRSLAHDQIDANLLRPGDSLLEKSGGGPNSPVGFAVMFDGPSRSSVCSNFVAALRPANGVHPRYASLLLASMYRAGSNVPYIKQSTGIQNLDGGGFLSQSVVIPEKQCQAAIADALDRDLDTIRAARGVIAQQLVVLEERRRALIAAAVSGQIDVTTARGVEA